MHDGLAYRELQRELGAANGTLRHHLDVLISSRSVTVIQSMDVLAIMRVHLSKSKS